jgi:tetratricopeptide (TPR) repeat protein
MLSLLFALAISDSGDVDIVQSYIDEKKWDSAAEYSTQCINRAGFLDADINLFVLRGQCYYKLKKYSLAIEDLSRAITSSLLDKDQVSTCYKFRGMCYFKTGLFEDAERDAKHANDKKLSEQVFECRKIYNSIDRHKAEGRYDLALIEYHTIMKNYVTTIDTMIEAAQCALDAGREDEFLEISSKAVEKEAGNIKVLEQRGRYFMCSADYDFAKRHLLACAKKATGQCKCPTLNRQNNEYKKFYEKFEEAVNQSNKEDAETFSNKCMRIAENNCGNNTKLFQRSQGMLARSLALQGKFREASRYLEDLLAIYPNSTELLLERGQVSFIKNDIDDADKYFQSAKKIDEKDARIDDAIAKVFAIREAEKRCDYYQLLNISRTFTSKAELKDAARKATRLYHPDQYSDPAKKKDCERKMVHVNRAVEILGDPIKRALYDRGEDPDNPGFREQQEKMRREQEEDERRRQMEKEKAQKKKSGQSNEKTRYAEQIYKEPAGFGADPFGLGGNPWADF